MSLKVCLVNLGRRPTGLFPVDPGQDLSHRAQVGSPLVLLIREGVQVPSALSKALSSLRVLVLLCPQEVHILRGQLGDKLQIKLDAEPTVDLSRVLDEMRCHYEAMMQTGRNDVEQWFRDQVRAPPRGREGPPASTWAGG